MTETTAATKSPLAVVLEQFEFFDARGELLEFKEKQAATVNTLAPLARSGWYCEVATGKTAMSTAAVIFKALQAPHRVRTIVLMPPILIPQWYRWLTKCVRYRGTDETPAALMYRGSPAARRKLDLDQDFILMSIQVFKRDIEYLNEQLDTSAVVLVVDEATSIKNPGSANYRKVRDFVSSPSRELMLLTATPLSKPGDAYAYVKLVSPTIYRNQRHFEQLHVGERDFFDNVTRWENLEFLSENLMVNSVRLLQKEIWPDLDEPLYVPLRYELSPEHAALYKKLADEQVLLLNDGGKIDATTGPKLYTMLQQIVCNPGHFSGDPMMRSMAHELLDELLDELDCMNPASGRKLMVYGFYRMTNRALLQYLEPYGAVGFYSEVSAARQQSNLQRLLHDPRCRVGVGQPLSAGYGLDGLQTVISDAFFIETPVISKDFTQAVGRLTRPGQLRKPVVRIGIAEGTCQVRLHANLLVNDETVNKVQGSWRDLREVS